MKLNSLLKLKEISNDLSDSGKMHRITGERINVDDGEIFMSSRRRHWCNRVDHELTVGDVFMLEVLRDERSGISPLVSHVIDLRRMERERVEDSQLCLGEVSRLDDGSRRNSMEGR